MTRFSVEGEGEGDEDEIEEGERAGPSSSNNNDNNRRWSKKPRTSFDPTPKWASASTSAAPQIPSVRELPSRPPPEKQNIPVHLTNPESDGDDDFHLLPLREPYSEEVLLPIIETDVDDEDEDEEEEEYHFGEDEEEEEEDEEEFDLEMEQNIVGSGGGGVQPTEYTRPELEERGGAALGSSAPFSVTLTDPDVLDCAICYEPLNPPVFQCENGHTACASCCIKMKNKCASCSWPIGYNRCRAIEKVLESIRIPCPNIQHGCMESLSYYRKIFHVPTCKFSPISCPHPNCFYIALPKLVYSHFVSQHSNASKEFSCNSALSITLDSNQTYAFLCEKLEGLVFVLNRSIEPRGSLVNVVCILPTSSVKSFFYEVGTIDGESSIMLKTAVVNTTCWTGQAPEKKYLLVPNDFMSSGGQLKLGLTIRRTYS